MSNIINPSSYIKSVLQNGVGRQLNQLQRITFKFSKTHGGSSGLREFIQNDLVNFAKANPGVVVYLKPRRIGPPSITMEYLCGHSHYRSFPKRSRDDVKKWVEFARTQSGFPITRFIKNIHTDTPSIQGVWTPFTNKPTEWNIMDLPVEEYSKKENFFPTATEQLLKVAKNCSTNCDDGEENLPSKSAN